MCFITYSRYAVRGLISIGRRSSWPVVIRSSLTIDTDRAMCEEANKPLVNKLCSSLHSHLASGERGKMGRG